MNERAGELIGLYGNFRNEANKITRWFLPAKVLILSNIAATGVAVGSFLWGGILNICNIILKL